MEWTRNPPTETGYYWLKLDKSMFADPIIVLVTQERPALILRYSIGGYESDVARTEGQWYGPLTPPRMD